MTPHQMNCPHSDNGWCLQCVSSLADERDRAAAEAERQQKHAASVWGECTARGEILDAIQKEADGAWWYHAMYELRRLKELSARLVLETDRKQATIERQLERLRACVQACREAKACIWLGHIKGYSEAQQLLSVVTTDLPGWVSQVGDLWQHEIDDGAVVAPTILEAITKRLAAYHTSVEPAAETGVSNG